MRAYVVAVALLTLGPPAVAGPRVACLQLVDRPGDGTTAGVVPSRDALDIRSADVATGRRNLVAVLRPASVEAGPSLWTGVTYTLRWRVAGVDQTVTYLWYTDGRHAAAFDPDTAPGATNDTRVPAVGVDPAAGTVTWVVPRRANPAPARRGATFAALTATAAPSTDAALPRRSPASFSVSVSVVGGDTGSSATTYTDLAPSCLSGV